MGNVNLGDVMTGVFVFIIGWLLIIFSFFMVTAVADAFLDPLARTIFWMGYLSVVAGINVAAFLLIKKGAGTGATE